MLRTTKWKLEKAKVKVVFRLQFHATNIPQSGWEKLYISFIPTESGKIIAKTSKANVRNGTCKWADPIYETTRLLLDSRNKRYDDNLYKLVVGMGTSRSSILGEAIINLADYADASNPSVIALPLHGSDNGTILHVTVQLLTAKTGFREFEQQFDKGLQNSPNLNREVEPSIAASSSSESQVSDDHGNKVNTKTHFRSESKELISAVGETDIHEVFSDSSVRCDGSANTSETYYAEKIDSSSIHGQNPPTEKAERSDHREWSSDYSMNNDLAIAHEENHKLRGILEMAESSIFELKMELSALHSYANEMGIETQKIAHHLTGEISSGQRLEREIMVLRSECSKFYDELERLKEIKSSSEFIGRTQDRSECNKLKWANGLLLVEDRIRELQGKIHIGFHESDLSLIHSDLEVLLSIVQDLEKGTVQEFQSTRGFDLVEGKSLMLLSQLNESKAERENLVKKMDEMECYYESLVQELEENQKQILGEFQSLRYEHSTCAYTISTCKAEAESLRHDMNDQVIRFTKERHALGCINEELEKRVMTAESLVQELQENQEQILGEFQSLKNEHLTCKAEAESLSHDMNDRILKFAKERHELCRVNEELKKRATTAESLVQELQENQERILGEFQSLKNEHLNCKAEAESLSHDMNDRISKFAKERHELCRVNEELKKRVTTAESLVQELQENQERILGEFRRLKNEHLTCAETISTYKTENESIRHDMNEQILEFAKERHTLGCLNEELDKRVTTAESALKRARLNYSIAVTQLQKDLDTLSLQVLSMFETNQTLIKDTFSESLKPNMIENLQKSDDTLVLCEKQLLGGGVHSDEELCEISYKNLYLNVYSGTLEETLKAQFLELENSNENMQKLLDFLQEKFGNLLVSCDEQFSDRFSFNYSSFQDTGFQDITYMITKLEEIHNYTSEKIQDFKKDRDVARSELDDMRTKFTHDMRNISAKLDFSNTIVAKLQFQLESVAKKFKNSSEMNESYEQKIEGILTYLSSLELELNKLTSKDGNFVQEILGSDSMDAEFERGKSVISELNQENQDFLMPIENKEETTICEELEMENIRVVLKATLDEHYDEHIKLREKCSELTNKLSEQVLKTEEFKNLVKLKECEKRESEGPSESLRIAFMKEQCETTVQELKQELSVSKRHGEEILLKLQDVLDETESRKKSEVSYLKKIEELSFKIVGLEAELQSIRAELECALLNLECCKEEKEKIVALMQGCEEDSSMNGNASTAQIFELEGMKTENSILSMTNSGSSFQDLRRKLSQLHKANEELGGMYPNFKDFSGDGNALERVLALEIELAEALISKKNSSIQFQSSFLKQHGDEEAIFKSFRDINEVIKDTLEIKTKYSDVENELNEMHERYSQLSLQFAEVEGERQKLMMTIKNSRSPRNLGRSSSETLNDSHL